MRVQLSFVVIKVRSVCWLWKERGCEEGDRRRDDMMFRIAAQRAEQRTPGDGGVHYGVCGGQEEELGRRAVLAVVGIRIFS